MNQNENPRSGGASPQKPKKDILLPTMIALIAVMAAVLILGVSGVIRPGDSASSAPSSGGASIAAGASSADPSSGEYAVSSGEAAAAGGSVSGQTVASAPSASENRTDSSAQQSGSAATSGTVGSGTETVQRTETTGSAISQAAPKTQPIFPQNDSAAPSQTAPSPDGTGGSVSRQEYDKLTTGMSYDDVAAAFGDPGTLVDSAGSTKIYEWNGPSGASVRVTFKDGALAHKYKFGL